MADKIAVMNHGVIEQLGTPRDIYDRPASLFVADFIGSPPMNFLSFRVASARCAEKVQLDGGEISVPRVHENLAKVSSSSAYGRNRSSLPTQARCAATFSGWNIWAPRRS